MYVLSFKILAFYFTLELIYIDFNMQQCVILVRPTEFIISNFLCFNT